MIIGSRGALYESYPIWKSATPPLIENREHVIVAPYKQERLYLSFKLLLLESQQPEHGIFVFGRFCTVFF